MKIELSAEQAQSVIDSQARKIAALTRRLRKINVYTKYVRSVEVYLSAKQIQDTIQHLEVMIAHDRGSEENDYYQQYDHEVIQEQIDKYKAMLTSEHYSAYRGYKTSPVSREFIYAMNRYDDVGARNMVAYFDQLVAESLHSDEPATPDFFSSHDEFSKK